jgi:hypothetical protein
MSETFASPDPHIAFFDACIHTVEGRRRIAEELCKQFDIYFSAREDVTRFQESLEWISSGDSPLAAVFGAPAYVYGVAFIWPRPHGERLLGELRCRAHGCSSWTQFDLPEVLFRPNLVIGRGGGLLDAWVIAGEGHPPAAHCPTHRHRMFPHLPVG